ncbi:MAG: amidohydrolase family protein [Bryobacteraceae bacterium]
MFIVVRGGEIYNPQRIGRSDLLIAADKIVRIGDVDLRPLEQSGLGVEIIEAENCLVVPGFIDPHEHLLGGSGEKGWASQTPEIALSEIVAGGLTTVVGCLGTDTTTKTMPGLLAKAKAFNDEGLTAYIYSGGYNVPPVTLTGSVRKDMLFVPEVIGAGEIAISDARSTEPSDAELARLVRDTYVGGLLAAKSGITHFHVGSGKKRLRPLRTLLDEYEIEPRSLYPTHMDRSEELMVEAIELSHRGVTVDLDTVDGELPRSMSFYLERGGDPTLVTVSSDAAINSPRAVWDQIRTCVLQHGMSLETLLPTVTSNTASVLKLPSKGHLREGASADVVVLRKESLELLDVIARGRRFVRSGQLAFRESFLQESKREIRLHGERAQTPGTN